MTSELHLYAKGQDPYVFSIGGLTLVIHQGSPVATTPVVPPKDAEVTQPFIPGSLGPVYQNYIVAPGRVEDVLSILNAQDVEKAHLGLVIGDSAGPTSAVEQWRAVTEGLAHYGGGDASIHLVTMDDVRAHE